MSSVSRGYCSDTPSRRTHTRWTDDGECIEVIDLGFKDAKESGPTFLNSNYKKPAVKNPYVSHTPSIKLVSHSAVIVTPSDLSVRFSNAGTPSTNFANRRASSEDVHAHNAASPQADVRKRSVANRYKESKSVGMRTLYVRSDDKIFEAALAVPDPYGEARLDFTSSAAYYASRVYEARAGKPASQWTQDAYLPASILGAFKSNRPSKRGIGETKWKGPTKRRIGAISSYAPTFNPAPEDNSVHV